MQTKIVFAAIALALLSGCSSFSAMNRPVSEPAEGPTATLRVVTNGHLAMIPDRACLDWSAPGAGIAASTSNFIGKSPALNGQKRDMKHASKERADVVMAEIKVKANSPVTFQFESDENNGIVRTICEPFAIAFIPEAGEEYEIFAGVDEKYCRLYAESLSKPGRYPVQKRVKACS